MGSWICLVKYIVVGNYEVIRNQYREIFQSTGKQEGDMFEDFCLHGLERVYVIIYMNGRRGHKIQFIKYVIQGCGCLSVIL